MAPSKKSRRLLERQVSKTIAVYIDQAITSPPKHQPFQQEDQSFCALFLSFWQEYLIGVDLDQIYERKPEDPSWLFCYSNHAINSARLVLAIRDRNKVAPELRDRSIPLNLDSVALANVSRESFEHILRVLAETNESLQLSREPRKQQTSPSRQSHSRRVSILFYEEFQLAANQFDLTRRYEQKLDDPDWVARYSDQAINTIHLAMAVRAHQGFTYQSRLNSLPASDLSLEAVSLADVSVEQFLDMFRQLVDAKRLTQKDKVCTNSSTPLNVHYITTKQPGNDSDSENCEIEHLDNEQDCEALSDIDYGSDSTLLDEEIADDQIDGFESDEHLFIALEKWDAHEALEGLPEDVIGPLLDTPKSRKMTVSVLRKALGVANASNTLFKKEVDSVLRAMRKEYRIAHTRPFLYGMIAPYEKPITPLVYGYLILSSSVYTLRSHCQLSRRTSGTPSVSNLLTGLDMVKRDLLAIIEDLNDFPDAQEIMTERIRVTNIRLDIYQDTISHCIELGSILEAAYIFKGSANKPQIILQHENCKELWIAMESFMQFDEARLDKEYFQEFPGCLVKACGIMTLLKDVIDLKYLPACTQNEYLMKAVDIAKGLLKKWYQRSVKSENSLYVTLQ